MVTSKKDSVLLHLMKKEGGCIFFTSYREMLMIEEYSSEIET